LDVIVCFTDTHKQRSSRDPEQVTLSCASGQGDTVTTLNDTSKPSEKASKQNKVQEDLLKVSDGLKASVTSALQSSPHRLIFPLTVYSQCDFLATTHPVCMDMHIKFIQEFMNKCV